jgi:hypothetical protein
MTDKDDGTKTGQAEPVRAFTPLPETATIPYQLIDQWLEIPPQSYLEIRLTRSDFDKFYGSMNKNLQSQSNFQQAMIEYTNGRPSRANELMYESQRLVIESQNDLRHLMSAIMSSAIREKNNG